ncbi:NRDE family protein [Glaciecola sp. 1036]|uniref:NRDE family protein n=1 Tax=Alteromonadaceae TaxID=72275 RepID=UPI003D06FFE1
MCILFIAVNQHKDYPLIIAANRDEFHARPTLASHWWQPESHLLAGKDEMASGSWMGINRRGNIAAITNIRAPGRERPNAVTRGKLVIDYLQQSPDFETYSTQLAATKDSYNGYNLLFGSFNNLYVYNNFENAVQSLTTGVYGLSNAMLNTPWPKLDFGKQTLAEYCQSSSPLQKQHLFELLRNQTPAEDERLPKTGVPIEWERKLSSIFIKTDDYGTRSSTVLLVDQDKHVYWEEHSFNNQGKIVNEQGFDFSLQ